MEVTRAGALNEYDHLSVVAVKHPRDAFVSQQTLAEQWQAHGFTFEPDFALACRQFDAFVDAVAALGAEPVFLPHDTLTTIDSLYVRDASLVTPRGLVLCAMGKPLRQEEPSAQQRGFAASALANLGIGGIIAIPGKIEGGDVVWLDNRTVAVGRGYRTNAAGIGQLRAFLGEHVDVVEVPLPHWRGPADVMHLMSLISPVDRDLAVVYSPMLPVPFREWLLERDITLVETWHDEFDTMGTNVLTLAPRRCLMLAGNPRTRAALERAGTEVIEYEGSEISLKGGGGPTCLTRPLVRTAAH